mgnify:CR=1 FL=1
MSSGGQGIDYCVRIPYTDLMAKRKSVYYRWSAKIERDTLSQLQELAAGLGFIVDTPGGYFGNASPPAMLDALAAAYERDPGGTKLALKVILGANGLLPPAAPPDAAE